MIRALVTGATGMLGSHLVERLVAGGITVRIYARPQSDVSALKALPIEITYGDNEDRAALVRAVEGCQWIFHVAGLVRPADIFSRGNDFETLRRVNVNFTESILEASLNAGVERFFYVSSTSVYGLDAPVPISETVLPDPSSDYGLSKVMAEAFVKAYQDKGLTTTIIRPPIIYGTRDRHLTPLVLSLARLPVTPLIDGGKGLQDVVFVGDVVELIWLACQTGESRNKVYNASS